MDLDPFLVRPTIASFAECEGTVLYELMFTLREFWLWLVPLKKCFIQDLFYIYFGIIVMIILTVYLYEDIQHSLAKKLGGWNL